MKTTKMSIDLEILRKQRREAMRSTPTIQLAYFANRLRAQTRASITFHDLFMEELSERAETATREVAEMEL